MVTMFKGVEARVLRVKLQVSGKFLVSFSRYEMHVILEKDKLFLENV